MTQNQAPLHDAYTLIQSGKYEEAQTMLDTILRDEPSNVGAWYLASYLAESVEDRMARLRRVLELDPNHAHAREALAAAERDPFSASLLLPDDDSFLKPTKPKRATDPEMLLGIVALVLIAFLLGYVMGKGWLFAPRAQTAVPTPASSEGVPPATEAPVIITVLAEEASDEPTPIAISQLPRIIIVTATVEPVFDLAVPRSERIDDDPYIGSLDAPIVMVEFGGYEDRFTAKFHQETLPDLLDEYGDQILYVFRDNPLDNLHPNGRLAAEAANCANEQGRFWDYHNLLLANLSGDGIEVETLISHAQSLGLDMRQFMPCLDNHQYADEVELDQIDAESWGVEASPVFFINGQRIAGALPLDQLTPIIFLELQD